MSPCRDHLREGLLLQVWCLTNETRVHRFATVHNMAVIKKFNQQGVVTFIRPVEPSVTGIKIFDGQKFTLIAFRKGP